MDTARRGATAYLVANVFSMAAAALRYTLFARILSPEQLGLAATIILTASFFDSVTDMGSDRFLIQDESGDAPEALQMVHIVLIARGIVVAALLVLLSGPLASFYKAPQLRTGFLVLAAYPLIGAFVHADPRRQQRDHDFRAESICILAAETISLAVTVAMIFTLRSYSAAIGALIARSAVLLVTSHLTAKVKYHAKYSKEYASKISRFGGPLIFNGIGLFFGGQGDRLVIANRLNVQELGLYSAISLLIYYPSALLGRYLLGIQMPMVASARNSTTRRTEVLDSIGGGTTLLSIAQATGFALVAPFVVVPLYGPRFRQSLVVFAAIGFLQASRFIRNWPTIVALGIGRSLPVLVSNIVRLIALPLAIAAVYAGLGMVGLIGGFILGEIVAAVVNVVMVNSALQRSRFHDLDRIGAFAACGLITVASAVAWQRGGPIHAAFPLAITGLAIGLTLWREWRTVAFCVRFAQNFFGRARAWAHGPRR
jgi:O-antigen/teichoic acid export membrane protein